MSGHKTLTPGDLMMQLYFPPQFWSHGHFFLFKKKRAIFHHSVHTQTHGPVAQFMSDGEGDRQSRVLVDVAAAVRLAHPGQMGQTQGLTGLVPPSTDVFPGGEEQAHYVHHRFPSSTEEADLRAHACASLAS